MAETTSNPIGHFTFKDLTDASQKPETESKNFEDLASKLVQVPKAEIDEKRQES
jgi:hypothetical protein